MNTPVADMIRRRVAKQKDVWDNREPIGLVLPEWMYIKLSRECSKRFSYESRLADHVLARAHVEKFEGLPVSVSPEIGGVLVVFSPESVI